MYAVGAGYKNSFFVKSDLDPNPKVVALIPILFGISKKSFIYLEGLRVSNLFYLEKVYLYLEGVEFI